MSGVRPEWIAGNDFIMVHKALVAALDGDYEAAMVLDRINYRGRDGWWACSAVEMQAETCLSEWKLRQALSRLRDAGFVESERVSKFDSTLRWRVVIAPAGADMAVSGAREPSTPGPRIPQSPDVEESSISSTQKVRTTSGRGVRPVAQRAVTPLQHPARQITSDWSPRPEFLDHLAVTYPFVNLGLCVTRFVNYKFSKQATSKSFEAELENWVANDNEKAIIEQHQGTDDLGMPRTQRTKSAVPDAAQPGDPDYFDGAAYLDQTTNEQKD